MTSKIKITKPLCSGEGLMLSDDDKWYTNGHWMVREDLCRVLKSAPELSERKPPASVMIDWLPLSEYRPATVSNITLQGARMVYAGDAVAWVGTKYTECILEHEFSPAQVVWIAEEHDPVVVADGTEVTGKTILAAVMPVSIHFALGLKAHNEVFARWVDRNLGGT